MKPKDFIQNARFALGYSVQELADELNIEYRCINRWERGKIIPRGTIILEIIEICREKGIDLDSLLPLKNNIKIKRMLKSILF